MSLFGACQICIEKDKHIALLKDQVEMLRAMALPSYNQTALSLQAQEMDHILSGSDEAIDVSEAEVVREASAILTGSYDQSNQIEFE